MQPWRVRGLQEASRHFLKHDRWKEGVHFSLLCVHANNCHLCEMIDLVPKLRTASAAARSAVNVGTGAVLFLTVGHCAFLALQPYAIGGWRVTHIGLGSASFVSGRREFIFRLSFRVPYARATAADSHSP